MAQLTQEVWLDIDMAGARLGITGETARKWCLRGKFPNATKEYTDRWRWRIPMSDLLLWTTAPEGITTEEAAVIIGIHPRRIGKLCRRESIKGTFWRGKWYVDEESAREYAKKRYERGGCDYETLKDPEKLWACYVENGHSFRKGAKVCRCSNSAFREYFHKAGLKIHERKKKSNGSNGRLKVNRINAQVWGRIKAGAFKKVTTIPPKCPRGCPNRMDCLEEGSVCFFDPDKVPLDTQSIDIPPDS